MKHACSLVSGSLCLAIGCAVSADIVTLEDANSSAWFDTQSQEGMYDWFVDGVDHLYQQWFWYRIGTADPERSLDTLMQAGIAVTDTNPFNDPRLDTLAVLYTAPGLRVETTYVLRGGANGSGVSDVTEQIVITNVGNETFDFSFFEYVDFDLNETAQDDSVRILGGNTAIQTEGGTRLTETVVTPAATTFEVGFFSDTLDKLNDAVATTLTGDPGPLGPGDLTWAFQWDFELRPGQSFIVSKDKSLVPAPSALGILAAGLLLVPARKRRH